MLVTANKLLRRAQKGGYAVGAFSTYNLEITRAILRAAEARKAPVILQAGSGALEYAGREALGALMVSEARRAKVPVAVQLDHSTRLQEIAACIRLGFSSVMVDGSALTLARNIGFTRKAVALAHSRGVSIEGELGHITGDEDRAGRHDAHAAMTDPGEAERFARETKVDALAVSVGNVHGFYRGEPRLDIARLREIRKRVSVPLVLHGASGLPDRMIRDAIRAGVCKFNVNTEVRAAFFSAIARSLPKATKACDLSALFVPAIAAMQRVVEAKLAVFGSGDKGVTSIQRE